WDACGQMAGEYSERSQGLAVAWSNLRAGAGHGWIERARGAVAYRRVARVCGGCLCHRAVVLYLEPNDIAGAGLDTACQCRSGRGALAVVDVLCADTDRAWARSALSAVGFKVSGRHDAARRARILVLILRCGIVRQELRAARAGRVYRLRSSGADCLGRHRWNYLCLEQLSVF